MNTVFISLPMNGYSMENIEQRKQQIIEKLGPEFVDIAAVSQMYPGYTNSSTNTALNWLGNSIMQMSNANYVYFAPGWENARGCRIEHECAVQYDMPILTEEDFVDATSDGENAGLTQ